MKAKSIILQRWSYFCYRRVTACFDESLLEIYFDEPLCFTNFICFCDYREENARRQIFHNKEFLFVWMGFYFSGLILWPRVLPLPGQYHVLYVILHHSPPTQMPIGPKYLTVRKMSYLASRMAGNSRIYFMWFIHFDSATRSERAAPERDNTFKKHSLVFVDVLYKYIQLRTALICQCHD